MVKLKKIFISILFPVLVLIFIDTSYMHPKSWIWRLLCLWLTLKQPWGYWTLCIRYRYSKEFVNGGCELKCFNQLGQTMFLVISSICQMFPSFWKLGCSSMWMLETMGVSSSVSFSIIIRIVWRFKSHTIIIIQI